MHGTALSQSRCFEPVVSFLGMHLKETMKHLFQHIEIYLYAYPFILACFIELTSRSVPCLYHRLPQALSSQALPGLEPAGKEVWLWRCKKGVKSYHRTIGTSECSLLLLLNRFSCVWLCVTHGQQRTRLLCPQNSTGKNTLVDYHFLLHFSARLWAKPLECITMMNPITFKLGVIIPIIEIRKLKDKEANYLAHL